jgi:hypothetical protein
MNALKERVMVVNLHISQWGARRYDEKVTREIEQIHQTEEAGRFNKRLMKSHLLDDISSVANKARSYHRDATLPWSDNNDRIITTDKYFEYVMTIGKYTMEMNQLVEQFVSEYVDLKEKEKIRLNGMYREEDYPHPSDIKDKFKLKAVFLPVVDADDFRVNLSDSMVDMMKQQLTEELNNRVKYANDELLDRVRKVVNSMIEKLSDSDNKFRDSLVGNIENMIEVIPIYNFSDNQHIKDVAEMLKTLVVSPDMLRNNEAFRKDILKKAQEIIKTI